MKSALKILLPLALLLAVVFAVTYMSRVTPTGDDTDTKDTVSVPVGKGLVFFTTIRRWAPGSDSLADQVFPGFFEPGETAHATQFWFENRNPGKVSFRLMGVSCSSCSGGRVAPIPPDAARALLQMAAVSALPMGPIGGCPTGMGGVGAFLTSKLQWQAHAFKDGGVAYDIPPSADTDGWSPGWGILELNFKVRPGGSGPLRAGFATVDETNTMVGRDEFHIHFEPAQGVEVDKSTIEVGELADNTPAQTHVVTVYSATRGPDELPDLSARVINPEGEDAGPFVAVGKAHPVPADDLDQLAATLGAKNGKPTRVRAAFRIPVTVAARIGSTRPDLGRLDRELWITAAVPGMDPKKVAVRATVTGPVSLAGAPDVNLGSFRYQAGASESVVLTTEQAGAVLEIVPGATRPDFLDATLKKLPDAGARGQWQLTVRVPPGRHQGEITSGLVVIEMKGATPLRVRVPVRGRGVL